MEDSFSLQICTSQSARSSLPNRRQSPRGEEGNIHGHTHRPHAHFPQGVSVPQPTFPLLLLLLVPLRVSLSAMPRPRGSWDVGEPAVFFAAELFLVWATPTLRPHDSPGTELNSLTGVLGPLPNPHFGGPASGPKRPHPGSLPGSPGLQPPWAPSFAGCHPLRAPLHRLPSPDRNSDPGKDRAPFLI